MKETDCRKCCVCAFKDALCKGDFCEKYYREGSAEDFEKLLPHWIPCSERLPEEDYCSGRGVQYSGQVLVTVVNHGNDDDIFVDTACTADGEWQLNYPQDTSPLTPKWCDVIAWMPLPEPYGGDNE